MNTNNHHRPQYQILPGTSLTGKLLQQISFAFPLTPDVTKSRAQWIAEHLFYFTTAAVPQFLGVYADSEVQS